jgi:phosphatidylinositol 3,5-bisphosphate 5-phosphatase
LTTSLYVLAADGEDLLPNILLTAAAAKAASTTMIPVTSTSRDPGGGPHADVDAEPTASYRHTQPTRLSDLSEPHPTIDELSDSDSDDPSTPAPSQALQRKGTASKSFTEEEDAALLRKLDRRLILFLALLYLLSFLDRSNIGRSPVLFF